MSVILPSGSMLTQPLRQLSAEVYEIDAMADRSFDREAVGMLKELIRKIDPDIVHTHGSLSGRIAARACGKKIVYTRHCAFPVKGYMKHGPGRWANQLLNRRYADRIIAVGQTTKENLVESGISEKYIDMMMNGSEQIRLPEKEERRELRASYGFDDSDFVVGIMARIEVYKGHGDILKALHFLLEEGRKVKLIIAEPALMKRNCAVRRRDFLRGQWSLPVLSAISQKFCPSWTFRSTLLMKARHPVCRLSKG